MTRPTVTLSHLLLALSLLACGEDAPEMTTNNTTTDGGSTTTAAALTWPVVETGQEACYDTSTAVACADAGAALHGQDAQYQGFAFDLVNNGDGTVSDRVTGLMWRRDPGEKLTWDQAVAGAATFDLAGYDDWRLPTIHELYSLMDFRGLDPSGLESGEVTLKPFIDDEAFVFSYGDEAAGERLIDAQFATRTLYTGEVMSGQEAMFGVNFADGRIKGYPTAPLPGQPDGKLFFVLYVRGGDGYGVHDYEDHGDGTISDHATGLMWQRDDSEVGMRWEEALSYCEGLELSGHDDWRLPNAKELHTLIDVTRSPDHTDTAAIDPLFQVTHVTNEAGADDCPFYWTSTTHANPRDGHEGANAAYLAFGRAMGYFNGAWQDVHGAGAQRSDPKVGDPDDYPTGHGPQGDAIRVLNFARCVRLGATLDPNAGATPAGGSGANTTAPPVGPTACDSASDCLAPPACPPGAAGCDCLPEPGDGDLVCMPVCERDSDCPEPPDVTLSCSPDGVCVPR